MNNRTVPFQGTPLPVNITLDRTSPMTLADQISATLGDAVVSGRLAPGTRLPSWQDMATQLGVSRGTVRAAYERLIDRALIQANGSVGTHVAASSHYPPPPESISISPPMMEFFPTFSAPILPFQLGVPAQDAFPSKVWSRLGARCAQRQAMAPKSYPDPRGELELRREIAAYLTIARGICVSLDQIIVTNGYRTSLDLIIRALGLEMRTAWFEEPGFPIARKALTLAGIRSVPVRVDSDGLDVDQGISLAPDAAFAIVTPSQQAPLGVTLSPARRQKLLSWANAAAAWIVEDDYLGELQLDGRAARALAAEDGFGRVIHIGTFSKSVSPSIALGFVVFPASQAERFGEVAAFRSPAPSTLVQYQMANFISTGHYIRHLRRMKLLYKSRRDAVMDTLKEQNPLRGGCLSLLLDLPSHRSDTAIAAEAYARGIAPVPLSVWYSDTTRARNGLILCTTNCNAANLSNSVAVLKSLIG